MASKILLKVGNAVIPAVLNDTVAAQDFAKRLPLKLSGSRSDVDYRCHTACSLFDPMETQTGWKNGDISLAGGWFTVFFDGEEQSETVRGLMIIAHIETEYLEIVRALPATVKIAVELMKG